MGKIKHIIKKFKIENEKIRKYTDSRYIRTYFDFIKCKIRYGATPEDYFRYEFYNFSHYKRDTFITIGRTEKLKKLTPDSIKENFNNKVKFLEFYADFIGRDWMDLKDATYEEFEKFVKEHGKIIVKPLDSLQGRGIEIIEYTDDDSLRQKYSDIKEQHKFKSMLAEEVVVQHPEMYRLGKNSVNTLRIVTYVHNNECFIIGCAVRMGGDKEIDNFAAGGTCATVDDETGVIVSKCYRARENITIRHPYTGTIVPGFQIPNWDKAIDLCKRAALLNPKAVYVGWDVAVRENDAVLIEGNADPGVFQAQDSVGRYVKIREANKK